MKYSSPWVLAGMLVTGTAAAGSCDFVAGNGAATANQARGACSLLDGGRLEPKEGRERCVADGATVAEFVWRKGRRNGPGWFFNNNDQRVAFDFRDDKAHGKGEVLGRDGKLLCEIPFVDNKAEGVVREFYPSGRLRSASAWKNGKASGAQIILTENGEVMTLECAPQSMTAEDRTPCGHDGALSTVQLRGADGKPIRTILRYQGGVLKTQTSTDTQGHTLEKVFTHPGDRNRFSAREFFPDGKLYRTYTSNDHYIEGTYVEYAPSGQKKEESVYADRVLQRRTEWYLNGQVKTQIVRQNDGSQEVREYYDNGKLAREGVYALRNPLAENPYNRIPNGKARRFRENGSLLSEEVYAMGAHEGVSRTFHATGKVAEETEYRKDRLLSRACYSPGGDEILREVFFEDGSRKSQGKATTSEERKKLCEAS